MHCSEFTNAKLEAIRAFEEETEDESKKAYEKPELMVHGDLREITKSGGGNKTDVPIGTTVDDDATINDVTS